MIPSLAAAVAGRPIRGSWWNHPKGHDIFLLSRTVRRSPDVLVCGLVDGKITYVHRRLWPALIVLAGRFRKERLAALKEVHTPAGKHQLLITPFQTGCQAKCCGQRIDSQSRTPLHNAHPYSCLVRPLARLHSKVYHGILFP